MTLPTSIKMTQSAVMACLNINAAVDMLPADLNVPDRFFERCNEYIASKLPEGFSELLETEGYFFTRIEEKDGKTICVVTQDADGETDVEIPIELQGLPTQFADGDSFYNFCNQTFNHPDTFVECQDGSDDPDAAWVAVIHGDPLVKGATFGSGVACWYADAECQIELTEEQVTNWKQ